MSPVACEPFRTGPASEEGRHVHVGASHARVARILRASVERFAAHAVSRVAYGTGSATITSLGVETANA